MDTFGEMDKTLKAHIALILANLIYAANFTIAKVVMPAYIEPFGFILLRVIGAVILFWIVGEIWVKEKTDKKDIPKFALLGLCGVAINQLLFFKGLSITTPINASIMMITSPIVVVIIAQALIKERITALKVTGIFVGFAGAALLLTLKTDLSFGSETITGDMFIFINAVSWSFYMVLAKPLMKKYNTITIVKWVFLFGLLYVLPFGYKEFTRIEWSSFPSEIWIDTAFVVIGTTFFAYLLNTYALKELSPSIVSAYIYIQPVLTTLIAVKYGSDQITWPKAFSALLIFTGVYMTSKKELRVKS
jgi:drug/metabolite transporter (DMT)-like permease